MFRESKTSRRLMMSISRLTPENRSRRQEPCDSWRLKEARALHVVRKGCLFFLGTSVAPADPRRPHPLGDCEFQRSPFPCFRRPFFAMRQACMFLKVIFSIFFPRSYLWWFQRNAEVSRT